MQIVNIDSGYRESLLVQSIARQASVNRSVQLRSPQNKEGVSFSYTFQVLSIKIFDRIKKFIFIIGDWGLFTISSMINFDLSLD